MSSTSTKCESEPFFHAETQPALAQVRSKLKQHADGDQQFVKILSSVLDQGLSAVEAACAEALEAGIASGDVILTVLARRQQPEKPPSITGFVRARASLRICDVGAPFVHATCMMASASFAALAKRERRREAGTIWL
jgi:hypothetical protein